MTDPAVHRLWIADDIDLYLTTWRGSAEQVSVFTPSAVLTVAPAVRAEFASADDRQDPDARKMLGLPAGPLALLSSGS